MLNGDVLGYCCQAEFPSDRLKLTGPLIYRVRHSCILYLFVLFSDFLPSYFQSDFHTGSPLDSVVNNSLLTISWWVFPTLWIPLEKTSANLFACLWQVFDYSIHFVVREMLNPKAFRKSECIKSRESIDSRFNLNYFFCLKKWTAPFKREVSLSTFFLKLEFSKLNWNCTVMTALAPGAACDGTQPPTTLPPCGGRRATPWAGALHSSRCVTLDQQEALPCPEAPRPIRAQAFWVRTHDRRDEAWRQTKASAPVWGFSDNEMFNLST